MSTCQRCKPKSYNTSNCLQPGSDEDNGLSWLGDLLDPWKGWRDPSNNHIQATPTDSMPCKHALQNKVIPNLKEQAGGSVRLNAHQDVDESLNIIRNVVVLDEDESYQSIQKEKSLHSFKENVISVRQVSDQVENSIPSQQNHAGGMQNQPTITFSMLFNHSISNAEDEIIANIPEKRQQKQLKLCSTEHQKLETNNQGAQINHQDKFQFNQNETIQIANYYPSRRKKVQKRLKMLSKKRYIPPSEKLDFQANMTTIQQHKQQKLKDEQRRSIRMQNLMKLQTKKGVDLIDCLQDNISISEDSDIDEARSINFEAEHIYQIQQSSSNRSDESQVAGSNNIHLNNQFPRNNQRTIVSSIPQRALSPQELEVAREFEAIIHIIKDRQSGCDKQYKWEIGIYRSWKTISEALHQNFYVFIRQSKKYKSKFLKYLPKNIKQKKQGHNKFEDKLNEQGISKIKREKINECRIKAKNRKLGQLKDIFDKILLTKVIQYEKLIEERGRDQILQQFEDDLYTEYEPDTPHLQGIIQEIIINTNNSTRKRRNKRNQSLNIPKQIKATNQLLIHKLCEATQGYNYIESMNNLFNLNRRHPTLSCLDSNGLGLRSTNLKMIDKATFDCEMKRIKLMKQAILLNDFEPYLKIQANAKLQSEKKLKLLKLQ